MANKRLRGLLRIKLASWFLCCLAVLAGAAAGAWLTRKQLRAIVPVAIAEGNVITENDFYHRLETSVGPQVINALAQEKLVYQFARKRKALPSDTEVRQRVQAMMARADTAQSFRQKKLTEADITTLTRAQLTQEHLFGAAAHISEQEIQDYYRAQTDPRNSTAEFYTPERLEASCIVTPIESEIRKAWQDLQNGRPFADVARQYSKDKSAQAGGTIPPIFKGRSNITRLGDIEKRLYELRPSELLPPIKLGQIWFIFLCNAKAPAVTQPLEAVRSECIQKLQVMKSSKTEGEQAMNQYLDFRSKANIQVFWDRYTYDLSNLGQSKPANRAK